MSFQIFAPAKWRSELSWQAWIIAAFQIFFMVAIPAFLIIVQVIMLIFTREYKKSTYYIWTVADLVMNFCLVWIYPLQMQNFTIEHTQNMVNYEQLELEDQAETSNGQKVT